MGYGSGPSMFQSALRSEERSDHATAQSVPVKREFQSALRSEERSDGDHLEPTAAELVSIRASLRRAKRWAERAADRTGEYVSIRASLRRAKRLHRPAELQPRGAVSIRASLRRAKRFWDKGQRDFSLAVSIRASLRRAKRSTASCSFPQRPSFNPRFAPKSEAMRGRARRDKRPRVSIRASLRRAKRLRCRFLAEADEQVSIRASLRRAKRSKWKCGRPFTKQFQSALRSEERSDIEASATAGADWAFQSALRSEERSDPRCSERWKHPRSFNPRFAPKSEAMHRPRGRADSAVVSIRASLRRAKRCSPGLIGRLIRWQFQSALRSEERSD